MILKFRKKLYPIHIRQLPKIISVMLLQIPLTLLFLRKHLGWLLVRPLVTNYNSPPLNFQILLTSSLLRHNIHLHLTALSNTLVTHRLPHKIFLLLRPRSLLNSYFLRRARLNLVHPSLPRSWSSIALLRAHFLPSGSFRAMLLPVPSP
jgi:hypothetical protein